MAVREIRFRPTRLKSRKDPGIKARLFVVRALHSAVFFVELSAILWLVISGSLGREGRSVRLAAILVVGESAVFVGNRGVCPLTPLAERLGAESGSVSDIFLPDVVARTIPIWSIPLVLLGFGLHARRWWSGRQRGLAGEP